jgi:hypothetical protein
VGYRTAQQIWPTADDGSVVLVGTQLAAQQSGRFFVKRVWGSYPTATVESWDIDPGKPVGHPPLAFQPAGHALLDMLDQRVQQAHRAGTRVVAAMDDACHIPGDPVGEVHSCARIIGVDVNTHALLSSNDVGISRGDCGYAALTTFGGNTGDRLGGTVMCVSGYHGLCPAVVGLSLDPLAGYASALRGPGYYGQCYDDGTAPPMR